MNRFHRYLFCASAALLSGCHKVESAAHEFRAVGRPELRLVEGVAPAPAPEPWFRLDLGQAGDYQLTVHSDEFTPDPSGDPKAPQLHKLHGQADKHVRIPIAERAKRMDRAHVRLYTEYPGLLELRWSRGGKMLANAVTQLFPELCTSTYTLDVPIAAPQGFDEIEFVVYSQAGVCLGEVDLEELSVAQRLPQPPSEPGWVHASEDLRAAWGLATGAPLETRFEAHAGSILVASAIVPQALRVPGSAAMLAVTLTGGAGQPRVHRWPLVTNEGLSSSWIWIRVPLDDLAGRDVCARFELVTAGQPAVCALTQPQVASVDDQAPTVLLITSDTHRGDYLGCAPDSSGVATPVLDRLASEGVLFENCLSSANVTIPSHSAIMTGVSPRDTRLLDNMHSLSPDAVTLAERFRENGWATLAAVSAAHLDAEWCGLGQGFDRVAVSALPKREAGSTLALLEDWIPDYRGRPLFVWMHLYDAHEPYGPPPPFDQRYWAADRDPRDASLPDPRPGTIPDYFKGIRDPDWIRARYKGEVSYLDNELARLFERPRFQAATIAFTADHGESLGGHDVWWDHAGMYQDTLHVPLILRWPGGPRGMRVSQRVSNIDLGRTLLDLADLARVPMPGKSLLDAVDPRGKPAEPVYAIACFGLAATVTDGKDHLVLNLRDYPLGISAQRNRHAFELYDLGRDPACEHDLAAENPGRARELREKLIAWLRAADTRPWSKLPQGNGASVEQLAALGYVAGDSPGAEEALFPAQCDCPYCHAVQ
ncbi:MAG: sulfatase [Planctomycetes bacterium]|nr:sulfatase [Planctomycetota bacterium]